MIKLVKIIFLTLIILLAYSKSTAPAVLDNTTNKIRETNAFNFLEIKRYNNVLSLWINQLGYDESRNNWLEINKIGAFSEYQFLTGTLKMIGYHHITLKAFKKDPNIFPPELQKEVLITLMEYNSTLMETYIKDLEGTELNGIIITKSGILAACHLAGAGNVKLYFKTNGKVNKRDMNGTSVETYLRKYQNFDLTLRII